MLKILPSTAEYMGFAKDINSDSNFCTPIYSSDEELFSRLLDSPKQSNKLVLGCFEGEALLGLFCAFGGGAGAISGNAHAPVPQRPGL